jgi:hypothetical protein
MIAILGRIVGEYKGYFNEARPHQGIGQGIPGKPAVAIDICPRMGLVATTVG